jgi:hypothetical protein
MNVSWTRPRCCELLQLAMPLREGDRVEVTAQREVSRNRDNVPSRICVEATKIQHLGP